MNYAVKRLRRMASAAKILLRLDAIAQTHGIATAKWDAAAAALEEEITAAELWLRFGQTGEIKITKARKK